MDYLRSHIEALVFCASTPIKAKEIQLTLEEMLSTKIGLRDVKKMINELVEKYLQPDFSFELCHVGGGYQFLTKPDYQKSVELYLTNRSRRGLSRSALETLAIIAYKQPITKSKIEVIRGVGCDYSIRKLLEKELVVIKGKAPLPGRPLLYGTSRKFMYYFGINTMEDLPLPEDLERETEGGTDSLEATTGTEDENSTSLSEKLATILEISPEEVRHVELSDEPLSEENQTAGTENEANIVNIPLDTSEENEQEIDSEDNKDNENIE